MRRPSTRLVELFPALRQIPAACSLLAILMFLVTAPLDSTAQAVPKGSGMADNLGPHTDRTRGCSVCHPAHSWNDSTEPGKSIETAGVALWGKIATPDYGVTVPLTNGSRFVEVHAGSLSSAISKDLDVLVCISCHDGSLTPVNMMQSRSYESQVGLLAGLPYNEQETATLLEQDEIAGRQHPVGPSARIPVGNGLVWSNGNFSVIPGSPYAQFVANYGWPALAPRERYRGQGVGSGEPYVTCTTCHDQHFSNVYVSRVNSPIAGDGGGEAYTTYFFVNGPYNPRSRYVGRLSSSATQFCRQCHFDKANEGNNTLNAPTFF